MELWSIIVIALMVILTVIFISYPLYAAERAPSTPVPSRHVRKSRKRKRKKALKEDRVRETRVEQKRQIAEAVMTDEELEEEIEQQVRTLRRRK